MADPAETVLCGRSLGLKHVRGVQVPCPENHVCLNVWFRGTLRVDRVLSGPALPEAVTVASLQHTNYAPQYEARLRLFTVVPIEDEALRQQLGAGHLLRARVTGDDPRAATCDDPTRP